jgi:phenylalanyl-tRNA synthetase beta chain
MTAELFLDAIPAKRGGAGHMRSAYAPPPLQAVTRDFAFIVPDTLAGDRLLRAVKGADKVAIAEARIFDVFTGESVGAGLKSVAIEVVLQPVEKSFDEAALKEISEKIVAAAAKLDATLRG